VILNTNKSQFKDTFTGEASALLKDVIKEQVELFLFQEQVEKI